jgi:hypothetical protein
MFNFFSKKETKETVKETVKDAATRILNERVIRSREEFTFEPLRDMAQRCLSGADYRVLLNAINRVDDNQSVFELYVEAIEREIAKL